MIQFPLFPNEKYEVIYADPPWKMQAGRSLKKGYYEDENSPATRTSYPHMTVEEIKSLGVPSIAAVDCHLYMWTTNKHLPEAFEVIKAWGFQYSTCIVWAKNMMGGGLGGTFKINTEYLLFATKGSLAPLTSIKGTWFNIKRKYENGAPKHSKKPDFFYELIEKVSPGKKIELFARDHRKEWDCWGNELLNDVEI